jgi:hypothetical protein
MCLLRLRKVGLRFAQFEFLLRGIEPHHFVAGMDQLARLSQEGDPHIVAADGGRGQHFRAAALQLAAGTNRQSDGAALHARGRDCGNARRPANGSGLRQAQHCQRR